MIISRGMETSACMAGKTRRERPGRKNPCKTGMISGKTAIECPNPQALPALSGVLRQGTLSAQEEERKVFTGGRKNNSLLYFLIFYSMSLHSAPPSFGNFPESPVKRGIKPCPALKITRKLSLSAAAVTNSSRPPAIVRKITIAKFRLPAERTVSFT